MSKSESMGWIDHAEDELAEWRRLRDAAVAAGRNPPAEPTPVHGVGYRSLDGRWRVAVNHAYSDEQRAQLQAAGQHVPPVRWFVWDMRGKPTQVLLPTPDGLASPDEAIRVASSYARSRGLRTFVEVSRLGFDVVRLVARRVRDFMSRETYDGPPPAPAHAPVRPPDAPPVASPRGDQAGNAPADLGEQSDLLDRALRRPVEQERPRRRRRR